MILPQIIKSKLKNLDISSNLQIIPNFNKDLNTRFNLLSTGKAIIKIYNGKVIIRELSKARDFRIEPIHSIKWIPYKTTIWCKDNFKVMRIMRLILPFQVGIILLSLKVMCTILIIIPLTITIIIFLLVVTLTIFLLVMFQVIKLLTVSLLTYNSQILIRNNMPIQMKWDILWTMLELLERWHLRAKEALLSRMTFK